MGFTTGFLLGMGTGLLTASLLEEADAAGAFSGGESFGGAPSMVDVLSRARIVTTRCRQGTGCEVPAGQAHAARRALVAAGMSPRLSAGSPGYVRLAIR